MSFFDKNPDAAIGVIIVGAFWGIFTLPLLLLFAGTEISSQLRFQRAIQADRSFSECLSSGHASEECKNLPSYSNPTTILPPKE